MPASGVGTGWPSSGASGALRASAGRGLPRQATRLTLPYGQGQRSGWQPNSSALLGCGQNHQLLLQRQLSEQSMLTSSPRPMEPLAQ